VRALVQFGDIAPDFDLPVLIARAPARIDRTIWSLS